MTRSHPTPPPVSGIVPETIPEITPEEEALLARIEAAGDPDDIFPTEEELAEAARRPRGRPRLERPRQHVSLRLDPDVLAHYRATGPGWQSRINEVLRKAIG